MNITDLVLGNKYTCPICNEAFRYEEKLYIKNQPVCSWRCFLKYSKEYAAKKKAEELIKESKPRRGRKKKIVDKQ